MSTLHAIVLGIVQGLSEFLPISSSGHLAIVQWLFGWDDFGTNETLSKTFDVAVHLGTLAGAVTYFRKDIVRYLRCGFGDLFRRERPFSDDGRVAWLLVLSAVPAAIIGALFNDAIGELDNQIWLIAIMLIVFGFVLLWADRLDGDRLASDWRWQDALTMGLGQALALQPGVSRSGATITVGLWRRFRRDEAARLAFLMSIPVIAGAGLYQGVQIFSEGGIPADFRTAFFWGVVSSAITGWFAVWFTLRIVRTRTFLPFVIYRVAVGVIVLLLIITGVKPATG